MSPVSNRRDFTSRKNSVDDVGSARTGPCLKSGSFMLVRGEERAVRNIFLDAIKEGEISSAVWSWQELGFRVKNARCL